MAAAYGAGLPRAALLKYQSNGQRGRKYSKVCFMEHTDIVVQIKNKLTEIETAENADVIMAVESGSRAWGFAAGQRF